MLKRIIIWTIVISALLWGLEFGMPLVLSKIVAQSMSVLTGNQVTAKLEKHPALLMLGGEFDRVTLDADDAKISKLSVHKMHIVMDNVTLDRQALWQDKKAAVKSVGRISCMVAITQEDLANYLDIAVKGVKGAKVEITPDKVTVNSQFTLWPVAALDVKLDGKIIADKQKAKFIPNNFSVNNHGVSPGNILGGSMLAEIPILDSSMLPFGLAIRSIEMQAGQIVIRGDNGLK